MFQRAARVSRKCRGDVWLLTPCVCHSRLRTGGRNSQIGCCREVDRDNDAHRDQVDQAPLTTQLVEPGLLHRRVYTLGLPALASSAGQLCFAQCARGARSRVIGSVVSGASVTRAVLVADLGEPGQKLLGLRFAHAGLGQHPGGGDVDLDRFLYR